MSTERTLPQRRNPHLQDENSPPHEVLVERRKASTTDLKAMLGTVGLSNATKASNLGTFDYVHLQAPLPKNLKGAELFLSGSNPPPTIYYLMRRSTDGFISVTGMFKASFPWASKDEEAREKAFYMSSADIDREEIAGNIWAREEYALDRAAEYGISNWIVALLDPHPVHSHDNSITLPPTFEISPASQSPINGNMSTRKQRTTSRDIRSVSPMKQAAPAPNRPKATPRKRRARKHAADATASIADSGAEDADYIDDEAGVIVDAEDLLDSVDEVVEAAVEEAAALEAIRMAETTNTDAADGEEALNDNTVRVSVTEDVVAGEDDTETTRTTVKVEMPSNAPDLALPVDTEGVIAKAGEIVKDAKEMKEGTSESTKSVGGKKSLKRKAEALKDDVTEVKGPEEIVQVVAEGNAGDLVDGEVVMQSRGAKRTRIMVPAEEYRREKVKRRALMGLSGALAVGVMLPFISNLF